MKFKENFKRFFTLDRHHDAGFTLVELIVVIAILAILAGVAVPAYTGYIKKAEESADLQLLGALNTAFAAACLQNTVDVSDMIGAEAVLVDKKVSTIDITGTAAYTNAGTTASGETLVGGALLQKNINDAFALFFGDNVNTEFKVYIEIIYAEGGFQGFTAEDNATLGGAFTTIFDTIKENIQGSVDKLNGSTFGDLGSSTLMNKVDTVTGLASDLAGRNGTVQTALLMGIYGLADSLEMDPDSDEFDALLEQMYADRAAQLGDPTDPAVLAQAKNDVLANYAVLQAAQTQAASGKSTQDLLVELQAGTSKEEIIGLLKSDNVDTTQDGIAKTAMLYAMYTAYANQLPEGTDRDNAIAATGNALDFAANLSDPGFMSYLQGTGDYAVAEGETLKAATDLEGYLGALDIINQSADGNKNAVQDLLVNGYTNPELVNALQGLLGSK